MKFKKYIKLDLPISNGERITTVIIDKRDKKILDLLKQNPEMSEKEVAEKFNLSQPSINARIKILKKCGLIKKTIEIGNYTVLEDIKEF